jgi:hypothetical protein
MLYKELLDIVAAKVSTKVNKSDGLAVAIKVPWKPIQLGNLPRVQSRLTFGETAIR